MLTLGAIHLNGTNVTEPQRMTVPALEITLNTAPDPYNLVLIQLPDPIDTFNGIYSVIFRPIILTMTSFVLTI